MHRNPSLSTTVLDAKGDSKTRIRHGGALRLTPICKVVSHAFGIQTSLSLAVPSTPPVLQISLPPGSPDSVPTQPTGESMTPVRTATNEWHVGGKDCSIRVRTERHRIRCQRSRGRLPLPPKPTAIFCCLSSWRIFGATSPPYPPCAAHGLERPSQMNAWSCSARTSNQISPS